MSSAHIRIKSKHVCKSKQ